MSGQHCNMHCSMDDTFIQWDEILGEPSKSSTLNAFVDQKIKGIGDDLSTLIDEKLDEAVAELKEEIEQDISEIVLEIDPYKINYKDTTVGAALDALNNKSFECKIFDLGVFEKGQSFNSFTVGWSMPCDPKSQTIIRIKDGAPTERYRLEPSARSYTFPNVSSDEKYIVKGIDPNGEEFGTSAEVKFKSRWYHGTSSDLNPSNRIITNWANEFVDKTTQFGTKIFDCESGAYIYFAIPEDLHKSYDFFSNGLKDSNWVYEVKNVTNQFGYITPYRIYRSGNLLNGYNIYVGVESHDWY